MTSNKLKHEAKKQEWSMSIQECRGSGLSVSEWCRQRGVTTATYYRWERELLTGVQKKRSTVINGRDLCGVTGAETGIMQRSGTLRHTAYWEGQSGHLPRL